MSLKDNNLSARSEKSDVPTNNDDRNNHRILNILRSYEEELQQSIIDIDKDPNGKSSSNLSYQYNQNNQVYPHHNENELLNTNQTSPSMTNNSGSMPEENSSELEKDLINDAEIHSHLPIDELQNGFLTNLNNFMNNPNNKDVLKQYSKPIKPVKHLSDDASPMDEETDMSDIISTSLSDANSENKNTFSIISGISSKQVEDSHSNLSYLNYPLGDQQSSNLFSPSKEDEFKNRQDQISHISGSQMINNYMNKTGSLEAIPEDEEEHDANYNYADGGYGIPLGMLRDSKASNDLSSFIQNGSNMKFDEKSSQNENTPMSLVESQKHGRNNSGEFIGKKPSLMTIVEEDDANEENVEYKEEFEEENGENTNNEQKDNKKEDNPIEKANKSNNKSDKYEKIAKELVKGYGKDIINNKRTITQSESQHNLSKGHVRQIQTSNSTNSIPLQNYIKSYSGFNSKIINLNPIDDNEGYEYEYSDDTNEPISLMEASDINISSHQSGLNGSRTIDDLVAEQKKIQVASSSSAISSKIASKESNENNGHKKSSKKRSNISLSELMSNQRSSFTAEDMMRLQNVSFPTSKENSPQDANKLQKPKYSEKENIKDQKSLNKSQKNEESELDGNDILSSFIESQNSKAKSDKLTNLDEFINSDASTRGINADNIESIISNIEEKNSNEKNVSSGFDSSRFNDILNDNEEENEEREEEEEEEEEASFEQVTYEVITDNIDNKEEEVEYSDNSLKSDKGKKIESFSEKNSQKNSADDKKEIKGNKDSDLSLGNSILSDFTEGNSQSEHNKSDKASTRSSQSNRSISNSDIKGKSADESDDFINSITSDFIEAAAAEAEAEKEKKKENDEFESDFVDDEKENSNLNIEDPPSSLIESKSQSKTSDVQISVDFIEESESGKKSTKSDDSKSSSPKKSVESSISLSSDFADESKSDASSVATENQSISISFVEQSTHSSYSSSSTKKNKRKKKKKTNKKSIESTSEIKADSITSEFISEDKKSSSSASNSSKSNTAESFNNSSQFIDVESIKSNSKIESSNSISSKSGTVENESDFIDSLSSKSKTKSSSSSNKSSKISKSDSINVESIHSLDSNSKLSTNSNKESESTSIDGESIHSLSSSKSSSSKRSSESNKASESDSINVESIHSLKSSSSKSSSGSQSEKNSQSNKASESDSINVESIHSLSSSSTRSKNRSSSNRASQSTSINDESIHSLSSSASKSSSSKRSSESNKASESDSINIESIHSLKSSSSSKSSSSQSKSQSDSSRASDSIGIESIHSISSKSKSKSERSEMSKTSGFIDIESFHSPSSNEYSSSSSSKSTSKSHSEFINTLSSDSKKRRSEKSSEKTEDDVSKSKSKTSIDSSGFISSSKSESGSNVKSFFEFSEPASDATQKEGSPNTKALPKLQVIGSPKPGQTTKPKRLNVQGQSGKKGEKEAKKTKKHPHHVHVEKSSEKDDEIERPIKLSESKSKSKISTVSILDEIDSETSMSHLTISANSSEKASGEFIGTIDVIEDKSIVSNISNESSKGSEKVVYSDDSLRKEKVPKIPKVLLKKSKNFKNESPRRQKKKNEEDEVEIEDDFLDYNSRSEEENGRVLKFKKLEISKAYDYPSKFNEELDSSLNSTKIGKNEEIVEEENENEEVEVDNMTESIIKKPRKKTSKRVVIDLKNNNNKNESDDKNNTKSPIRFERLSMSPMFRNDIMPSKGNMSLTNITNISNNENRSKHSHAHKHKHRHQNKTELPIGIQKVQDVDNKKGIKTPQPIHRVIKISRSPTTITSNNTNITDTSIRVSNIPSAAEMVDQNYVNTLKSAKLSLQYIKESINASRQMRYTRQSAMDPFQYTVNP